MRDLFALAAAAEQVDVTSLCAYEADSAVLRCTTAPPVRYAFLADRMRTGVSAALANLPPSPTRAIASVQVERGMCDEG